jgi:hypothetical protein
MRTRAITLTLLTVLAGSLFATIRISGASSSEPTGPTRYSLGDAKAFRAFPLYYLGESFEAQRLEAIFRVNALALPGETTRRNDVSFIYGKCENIEGQPCLPPTQVQVWDACERYRDIYPFRPDQSMTLRGVPAAVFDEGRRLELYTQRVTIVIFGRNAARTLLAANALRGVNDPVAPALDLPAPTQAVLEGRSCS